MALVIKPMRGFVLVEPQPVKEEERGGLFVPASRNDNGVEWGTVIANGEGLKEDKSCEFAVGSVVAFYSHAGRDCELSYNDVTCRMLRHDMVVAVETRTETEDDAA